MDHTSLEAVMQRMDFVLDTFDAIGRNAHATYRSYNLAHLLEHSPRTQASCIYDHMAEEALRRFDGQQDVHQMEIRGLKLWLFGDHTVVRFKKMDEDGRSRNYPTKQAKAFDFDKQMEGLPPKPTRITVGYVLDKTTTGIDRVQVARPNGIKVDWCAAIVPTATRAEGARKWEEVTRQLRAA